MPRLHASVGYYYQHRDQEEVDGSGILGRLAYAINNDLTIGANLSSDEAYETRFSADLTWRFNGNRGSSQGESKTNAAVKALTFSPSNRDVRVHDFDATGCAEGAATGTLGGLLTGDPVAGAAGGAFGCVVGGFHLHWPHFHF